ncbi:hypothetical protein BAZSYMA_ACONTIG25576_0 [Bathymodiolus azoricus thioautotrophic gill symbiont]|uniref:Uncharacterized protein n=1 Tax=Bathymodiolus azoricus thioautotrophic gill symbiont TaxID=235205 RepID=A0A1H6K134_9GAMM|nr:hypothetical protein BAZSYMA_ACONTIG25576_0 [Bathymodiolus azoricus thioautotrophic gill symbiont]
MYSYFTNHNSPLNAFCKIDFWRIQPISATLQFKK